MNIKSIAIIVAVIVALRATALVIAELSGWAEHQVVAALYAATIGLLLSEVLRLREELDR